MSHQCVRCNTVFENNSRELMTGCPCGSRVFLYLKTSTRNAPDTLNTADALNTAGAPSIEVPKQAELSQTTPTNPDALEINPEAPTTREIPVEKEKKLAWLEQELAFLTKDKIISIDAESVENLRVIEKGCYELDVPSLMQGNPLVVKNDKGIYYIKLPLK
mgnify:CR=1 FL=1